jgi:hypothetical protein
LVARTEKDRLAGIKKEEVVGEEEEEEGQRVEWGQQLPAWRR